MPGQAAQGEGFLGGLLVPFRPSEKEPVMRGGTRSSFLPPTGGSAQGSGPQGRVAWRLPTGNPKGSRSDSPNGDTICPEGTSGACGPL